MEYLVGVVLGVLVGFGTTAVGMDRDRALYPAALIVIAAYYVLFAAMTGSTESIIAEITAGLVFVGLAVAGFRSSLWIAAAGIAGHGIFDLIHDYVIFNPGVPDFWLGFCSSIDIVLGLYLAWMLWRGQIRSGPA